MSFPASLNSLRSAIRSIHIAKHASYRMVCEHAGGQRLIGGDAGNDVLAVDGLKRDLSRVENSNLDSAARLSADKLSD